MGGENFKMASRILQCTMGNEMFQSTRKKRALSTRGEGVDRGGEKSVLSKENPIQVSRFVLASSSLESLSARLTIK